MNRETDMENGKEALCKVCGHCLMMKRRCARSQDVVWTPDGCSEYTPFGFPTGKDTLAIYRQGFDAGFEWGRDEAANDLVDACVIIERPKD